MRVFKLFLTLSIIVFIQAGCNSNPATQDPDTESVFFKIGEIEEVRGESFIIELTDPVHIAHARALINDPVNTIDKIVVARIVKQDGSEEYLNKDLDTDLAWSWRVDSFEGFGFNTIEILDGWPGYIEEDIDRWFQNTSGEDDHGVIGFWNYTIVSEVPESELK